jgi:Flp pilus assembly pilin Flp
MVRILAAVNHLAHDEDGQDLLEYALLVVLIAVVVIAGVTSVGSTVVNVFWSPIAQNF